MPRDDTIFLKLTDKQIIGLTIIGEARGEPIEGQVAVGCVIRNRVYAHSWFGKDWHDVCLKAWQFSCYNEGDPNRELLLKIAGGDFGSLRPEMVQCMYLAQGIIEGLILDNVGGANHYHDVSVFPSWAKAKNPIAQKGELIFYKL